MPEAGSDHLYKKVELAGNSIDPFTGGLITIGAPHALIHAGKVFHMSQKITSIANGAAVDFLIRTPATGYTHIHRMRASTGRGDIDIGAYEAPTTTADGTPITLDNLNRNSATLPGTLMFSAPTVTGVGTKIHDLWIPPTATGTGGTVNGVSSQEAGEEWILAPSTDYLQRMTNNSGATINAWVEIVLYELNGLVVS